jgi:hypothetical protein
MCAFCISEFGGTHVDTMGNCFSKITEADTPQKKSNREDQASSCNVGTLGTSGILGFLLVMTTVYPTDHKGCCGCHRILNILEHFDFSELTLISSLF